MAPIRTRWLAVAGFVSLLLATACSVIAWDEGRGPAFNLAGILVLFGAGVGTIGLVAFRCGQAALRHSLEENVAFSKVWLFGGTGLLLIALVFGVASVIAISQFRHWRARVRVARGEVALLSNDIDQAIADFTEAIRINPSLAVAFNDRGAAWLGKNEYDKAIADCSEALRIKPTLANALLNRGQAWNKTADYEKALTDCSEAIRLNPKLANAFNNRAIALLGKSEYDEALADCNEAIRLDPKLADAFNNRALIWIGNCEFDKALADCNEAIWFDPKFAEAFNNRAVAWDAKGEYGKAVADLTAAVRFNPQFVVAYDNLAWLRATCADQHCRDGKRAVESATKACALSAWRNPNQLTTLAAACAEAGDFANATKWEQKAIDLSPREFVSEQRLALELYKAHKPMRQPNVHDLADCVWAYVGMQTRHNLSTLLASFKASRVGVGVPPNGEPIGPDRQKLEGALKLIPTATLPDGTRVLVVLADVKNLAALEPRSRFAEVAASDVIQLAMTEQSGIVIQILTPGRAAFAAISKENVVRLGQAPPKK